MNEKALKELSLKDREYLVDLLAKESQALTPAERGFLVARRSYLTKESLERYEIDGAENIDAGGDDNAYDSMNLAELKALAADREIELPEKAKKAGIVAALKADDEK